MERLTRKDSDGWYIEAQSTRFDMRRRGEEINRLAAYEDTGLTPEEFVELLETQQSICEVCRYNDDCKVENCASYQLRKYFRQGKEAQQ